MLRFYDKMPDMECISGYTLPAFTVEVEADSLENCRMQLIASSFTDPSSAVFTKECTAVKNGFAVTLTSSDTALSEGTYLLHFRFIGADGLSRRKLAGKLYIVSAAKGAV